MDDVRAIVQRAVKDLSVEKSLKTYEEVWLSKIFELREHTRSRLTNVSSKTNTTEKEEEQVSHPNQVGVLLKLCVNLIFTVIHTRILIVVETKKVLVVCLNRRIPMQRAR